MQAISSEEYEIGLLAAVFHSGSEGLARAEGYVCHADFGKAAHGELFAMFGLMRDAGENFSDPGLLVPRTKDSGLLDKLGGPSFFASHLLNVLAQDNVEHYAKQVRESSVRASFVRQKREILDRLLNGEDCMDDANWIKNKLDEITSRLASDRSAVTLKEAALERIQTQTEILNALDSGQEIENKNFIRTGIECIDVAYGGFSRGESIIIAARPGVGKSALAKQIASHASMEGKNVLLVSLEMEPIEIGDRIMAERSRISSGSITRDSLTRDEVAVLAMTVEDTPCENLLISAPMGDSASLSKILAHARLTNATMEGGLDLVVVDYLQLIGKDNARQSDYEIVTEASKAMKRLARELDCPVVSLSQFNRSGDQGGQTREPKLSDLRDSGSIEQDANAVFAIHKESQGDDAPEKHWIMCLKKRNAPKINQEVRFDGNRLCFLPLSNGYDSSPQPQTLDYSNPFQSGPKTVSDPNGPIVEDF